MIGITGMILGDLIKELCITGFEVFADFTKEKIKEALGENEKLVDIWELTIEEWGDYERLLSILGRASNLTDYTMDLTNDHVVLICSKEDSETMTIIIEKTCLPYKNLK